MDYILLFGKYLDVLGSREDKVGGRAASARCEYGAW